MCSGGDFYIRKDFDPKLGLTVVIIGAAISAVFYWFKMDLVAYAFSVRRRTARSGDYGRLKDADRVLSLSHRVPRRLSEDKAVGFDLHTADVLEQEYERRIGRR